MEQYKIDRAGWSSGPWDNEPDNLDFKHGRFDCHVRRTRAGHLCGYVDIMPFHPAYMKDYDSINVDVHGGLTYGQKDDEDSVFRVGFDCAHLGDISPKYGQSGWDQDATYKDIDYVRQETISLANQLEEQIGDTP